MACVLLLGAGTQSLAILPSLYRLGHKILMHTGCRSNYGDRSRYVSKVFRYEVTDLAAYADYVRKIVAEEGVDVVLPMGDEAALMLSKYQHLFGSQNVKTPSFDNFLKGYDKNCLMALCKAHDYPHPTTIDLSTTSIQSMEVKHFPFPAMLKPNCTTGGRGMVEVANWEELQAKYPSLHQQYGDYHLQRFVKAGGKQVKVQLYVDAQRRLIASSVMQKLRWYPNKAGSNCCAVSIEDKALVTMCHHVLEDLKWVGFADFDLIEDPDTGELLIMEINPRLPACIKAAMVAGVDWAEVLVNDALGVPQKTYGYTTGVYLRHLGLDFLWWLHSPDKWHTEPNWFRFFGGNIHYQDMSTWSDPFPFLTGTFNNVKKLFDPQFKQAKEL